MQFFILLCALFLSTLISCYSHKSRPSVKQPLIDFTNDDKNATVCKTGDKFHYYTLADSYNILWNLNVIFIHIDFTYDNNKF